MLSRKPIAGTPLASFQPNLPRMDAQHFETFTFAGDNLSRLRQALDIARYQARMAQSGAEPRVEDALA